MGAREEETRRLLHSHAPELFIYSCMQSSLAHIHRLTCTQAHKQTGAVCGTDCAVSSCLEGSVLCALGGRAVVFFDHTTGRNI